jgi:hypothetical protein
MTILKLFLISVLLGGVAWYFYHLSSIAAKLHAKLDRIQEMARNAKTLDATVKAFDELSMLKADCWHHTFAYRYLEIRAVLTTKYDIYKEQENNEKS